MNVDPAEIAKFEALASRWWDPEGDFRPLHDINPVRVDYILRRARPRRRAGARRRLRRRHSDGKPGPCRRPVTGLDMAGAPLSVARLHALESGIEVEYLEGTAESLALARPAATPP
jgi:2-polyprenyl-6-hydroxyphenyl methylase / 3-demethylubiquinone-9 3-methyltransferase